MNFLYRTMHALVSHAAFRLFFFPRLLTVLQSTCFTLFLTHTLVSVVGALPGALLLSFLRQMARAVSGYLFPQGKNLISSEEGNGPETRGEAHEGRTCLKRGCLILAAPRLVFPLLQMRTVALVSKKLKIRAIRSNPLLIPRGFSEVNFVMLVM